MLMYILLRLEMSVCTSGRFLNFPRWGPAGPEGQICFCCMTGGVLSGKQLPQSTHCSVSLHWSEDRVQICSSHLSGCPLHSPAHSGDPGTQQSPDLPWLSGLAQHAIQTDQSILGILVTAVELLPWLGASLAHWEKHFPSAAAAQGKGVVGGLGPWDGSILHPVPSSAASMPTAWDEEEPGEETFPSCIRNENKGIFTNSAASQRPSCAISPIILEDQLCCWWGLLCFCWAQLLLPDSIWKASWLSGVERETDANIHTPADLHK